MSSCRQSIFLFHGSASERFRIFRQGSEMQIDMPFFDSVEDALKAVVQFLGGIKRVGPMLFPDKSVDAATRYLLDCLNSDRHEKLSLTQIMMVMRLGHEAGFHSAFAWFAAEIGYDVKPITKGEELDRLTSVVEQSSKTLATALATLERIQRASAK